MSTSDQTDANAAVGNTAKLAVAVLVTTTATISFSLKDADESYSDLLKTTWTGILQDGRTRT